MTVLRALLNAERNPLLMTMLRIVLAETRMNTHAEHYVTVSCRYVTVSCRSAAGRKRKESNSTVLRALLTAKGNALLMGFVAPTKTKYTHIRT